MEIKLSKALTEHCVQLGLEIPPVFMFLTAVENQIVDYWHEHLDLAKRSLQEEYFRINLGLWVEWDLDDEKWIILQNWKEDNNINTFEEFKKNLKEKGLTETGFVKNPMDYAIWNEKDVKLEFEKLGQLNINKAVKVIIDYYKEGSYKMKLNKYLANSFQFSYNQDKVTRETDIDEY